MSGVSEARCPVGTSEARRKCQISTLRVFSALHEALTRMHMLTFAVGDNILQ